MRENRLSKALRDERLDSYETAVSSDNAKLSEFRQMRAQVDAPALTDERRSDVTGY